MPPARYSTVCAICQEELVPGEDQSPPVVVSCGHIFCADDLDTHMRSYRGQKPPCPICRVKIIHSTRLWPHIDEGKRRVSTSAPAVAATSAESQQILERIKQTTRKAKAIGGAGNVQDVMDVVTEAERTLLDLEPRKETKIVRALKPLYDEVRRIREELAAALERESQLSDLRAKVVELESEYDEALETAQLVAGQKAKLHDRVDELKSKYDRLKRQYLKLKQVEQENTELQTQLEKENKLLRRKLKATVPKQRVPKDDPSLEIY